MSLSCRRSAFGVALGDYLAWASPFARDLAPSIREVPSRLNPTAGYDRLHSIGLPNSAIQLRPYQTRGAEDKKSKTCAWERWLSCGNSDDLQKAG
jgi:hypothetical protein